MEIKYIVKSETSPHLYLVANVELGNRIVPFAFKPCHQIIYEAATFDTEADAKAACEKAAEHYNVAYYVPVILKVLM